MALGHWLWLLPLHLPWRIVWGQSNRHVYTKELADPHAQESVVPDRTSPVIDIHVFDHVVIGSTDVIRDFPSSSRLNDTSGGHPEHVLGKRSDDSDEPEDFDVSKKELDEEPYRAELLPVDIELTTSVSGPVEDPVPVDPRWPWWSLADPGRFFAYATLPGFNRWHFKIAGTNPLKQPGNATGSIEEAPSPTEAQPSKESVVRLPEETSFAAVDRERAKGLPTIPENIVELRPPLVAQALLRPAEMPMLPLDILAKIEEKAAIRFSVVYFLSPSLFQRISKMMRNSVRSPLFRSGKSNVVPRKILNENDMEAFSQTFNLIPLSSQNRTTKRPPAGFIALFNHPINLDGTAYELGALREMVLIAYANRRVTESIPRMFGGPQPEVRDSVELICRDISPEEAIVLLQYMKNTKDAYINVVRKLSDWIDDEENHRQITGWPVARPSFGRLSQHFYMWAEDLYEGTLEFIQNKLESSSFSGVPKDDDWVGRLRTGKTTPNGAYPVHPLWPSPSPSFSTKANPGLKRKRPPLNT